MCTPIALPETVLASMKSDASQLIGKSEFPCWAKRGSVLDCVRLGGLI